MRKLLLPLLLTLTSSSTFATINANTGFYIGGALAMNYYTAPSGAAFNSSFLPFYASLRPTIGYRYNDYLAAEAGYLSGVNDGHAAHNGWGSDELKIYSFDIAAKGFIPFESGFSLFGKAGLALTHQYVYNQILVSDPVPRINQVNNQIQPILGAGFVYNFTKNFATELSYTHYCTTGSIGNMEVVAFGLTYTFNKDTDT